MLKQLKKLKRLAFGLVSAAALVTAMPATAQAAEDGNFDLHIHKVIAEEKEGAVKAFGDSESTPITDSQASFVLWREDEGGNKMVVKGPGWEEMVSGSVSDYYGDPSSAYITTENGEINISGLYADQVYYLQEQVAPEGYKVNSTVYEIPGPTSDDAGRIGYASQGMEMSDANGEMVTPELAGYIDSQENGGLSYNDRYDIWFGNSVESAGGGDWVEGTWVPVYIKKIILSGTEGETTFDFNMIWYPDEASSSHHQIREWDDTFSDLPTSEDIANGAVGEQVVRANDTLPSGVVDVEITSCTEGNANISVTFDSDESGEFIVPLGYIFIPGVPEHGQPGTLIVQEDYDHSMTGVGEWQYDPAEYIAYIETAYNRYGAIVYKWAQPDGVRYISDVYPYDSNEMDYAFTDIPSIAAALDGTGSLGPKQQAMIFKNSKAASKEQVDFPGIRKTIVDKKGLPISPAPAETFSFVISTSDSDNLPQESNLSRSGAGYMYPGYAMLSSGDYTYYITETRGSNIHYDYDNTQYILRVHVDSNATPRYTMTIAKNVLETPVDITSSDYVTFTNTYNPKGSLSISKNVSTDEPIGNKTFKITVTDGTKYYRQDGSSYSNINSAWTNFTAGQTKTFTLPVGTYTIIEDDADIENFSHSTTITVGGEETATAVITKDTTTRGTITNTYASTLTPVEINKTDQHGDAVIGAVLQIQTLDGTPVTTWTTDGTTKTVRLTAGEYKLVETAVPSGYEKADDIYFVIE